MTGTAPSWALVPTSCTALLTAHIDWRSCTSCDAILLPKPIEGDATAGATAPLPRPPMLPRLPASPGGRVLGVRAEAGIIGEVGGLRVGRWGARAEPGPGEAPAFCSKGLGRFQLWLRLACNVGLEALGCSPLPAHVLRRRRADMPDGSCGPPRGDRPESRRHWSRDCVRPMAAGAWAPKIGEVPLRGPRGVLGVSKVPQDMLRCWPSQGKERRGTKHDTAALPVLTSWPHPPLLRLAVVQQRDRVSMAGECPPPPRQVLRQPPANAGSSQ
mmetsp:Transcript_119516/g.345575  ORF Transcript_119516/g.345575 Transcript_119516/m.345575 type:complete len:271 (+) Transcript_119516:404-1216(+)